MTETWFQQASSSLEENLRDLTDENKLNIMHRTRTHAATNGRLHGGVAIVSRQKTSTFKPFELINTDDFEVLAAIGKVSGFQEKFVVIAVYLPPNYTTMRAVDALLFLSDVVAEAKRKVEDCRRLIGGDFNQWDATVITDEHPDIAIREHGPT